MIQCQFINYLISSQDSSLLLINNITEDFLSDYPSEYKFIREHLNNYGKLPDAATFLNTFPDFEYTEVHEPASYLIDKLYDDRNERRIAENYNKVRASLLDGDINKARDLCINISEELIKARHIETIDLLRNTERYDAYVERCNDYDKYYVSTGFPQLDDIFGGWDRQEELATIVARPNVGKSWVLLYSAFAAVQQGLRVGIYSGEMTARKVGYRFDTIAAHISNSALTKGRVEVQNAYKAYCDSLPDKFPGVCKVLTPAMIDGPAGVNALRAFIEKDNLDILFVDQHSLLEDDRHGRSATEKASNISKDLKNLQVLKQIPIIAVSQQNREGTEEGIGLGHVAQSDRIGQDSTVVIFCEYKKDDNTADRLIQFHLVKSRDSVNMKDLTYAFDFDHGTWTYIPEQNNAVDGEGVEELRKKFMEDEEYEVFNN